MVEEMLCRHLVEYNIGNYEIICKEHILYLKKYSQVSLPGGGGGGVLGPKIAGGVPRATENWTQKDRGKNGILGPKGSNFARICTQKIVFVLVDEKKHPKKSCSILPKWKMGVKTAAHMYQPSHREYPPVSL